VIAGLGRVSGAGGRLARTWIDDLGAVDMDSWEAQARTGSVGGPPSRGEYALSWPLSHDDDQGEALPSPGVDLVPVDLVPVDDDWELDPLWFTAPRREAPRAVARLLSFVMLGSAVAATGWINVAGFRAPHAASHPIKEALMWAFAVTGTLLVIVSLILLVMAVIDARPWSRLRHRGAV